MLFKKKYKKIVKIEGMHCEKCAKKVKNTLLTLPYVKTVHVDIKKKIALIISTALVDDELIVKDIENLDYQVTGITTN